MAETPVPITTGNGSASIAGDLVSGNTYQQIKMVDGTIGGSTPLKVNADGSITASVYGNLSVSAAANQSVSGTVQTQVQASVAVVIIGGSILTSSTPNQSVSGTVGANITNTVSVAVDSVNAGSVPGTSTQPFNFVFNGGTWDRQRGNSSIGTLVSTGASSVITIISGNASVSGTVGASIIGTVPVTGTLNSSFTQPSSFVSGVTSVITGTASVQILVPAPAGQRNYITNVLVTNAAAVGTTVELFDAGQVIYVGYAAASGGGFQASFPTALRQSSIAGNLSALSSIQASVYVSASGYTAA